MEAREDIQEIGAFTFEQAFTALEETVSRLEAGGQTLQESLVLFERGQALSARCAALLDEAELKLRQITPEGDTTLPLER